MTGGVSKNKGIVRALNEELECDILISPDSQMAGAIGAAYMLMKNTRSKTLNNI